ncbi:MAG: ComF family protein [Cyanobacteriota bacterium]|nr:ComF family protein [Cyanobacteriota bacterium]
MPLATPLPTWFPLHWELPVSSQSAAAAEGLRQELHAGGLEGLRPLPWWSAGWYAGELRLLLLQLRRHPDAHNTPLALALASLCQAFVSAPPPQPWQQALLVPVPSGRRRSNPVPTLMASALADRLGLQLRPELLERNHAVAPQHHLARRQQRWRNQWHSFRALLCDPAGQESQRPVLLLDDVLTSGATALAAQRALQAAGWPVIGLLCLARTPRRAADPA